MSQLYEATCDKCGCLSELLVRHETPKGWVCIDDEWVCPSCQQCAGTRQSWPWKGYRCGNKGKYEYNGNLYCAAHLTIVCEAQKEGM
jgi:hypothetical protein